MNLVIDAGWPNLQLFLFQDPEIQPLAELDSKTVELLLPEIPLWVKNPDYDRVCYYCICPLRHVYVFSNTEFLMVVSISEG